MCSKDVLLVDNSIIILFHNIMLFFLHKSNIIKMLLHIIPILRKANEGRYKSQIRTAFNISKPKTPLRNITIVISCL